MPLRVKAKKEKNVDDPPDRVKINCQVCRISSEITMTTFSKTSDGQKPYIKVDSGHKLARINPNVYSGFTEHMGRCIYGGIYDPGNPLSDKNGFRKDVIEALQELKVPVVRYPGGNFVATYHWLDGVGPKESRPPRPELAWLGTETNEFGTDEFLKWCEIVGTEPYFALNFGTGTLDEALGWVEYCNGTGNTYYANLRRKNGRDKPYNVKYWALGNEMWGPWQVGQMTKERYAEQALQWAKAIKLLDPTVQLILCGLDGVSTWDHHVLQTCLIPPYNPLSPDPVNQVPLIAMHSIHMYSASKEHLANVACPLASERAIEITGSLIDLALITNKVDIKTPEWRPMICFDEWNVWDPLRAIGSEGAEETYTLSDALAVGVWLNVFVRQAKYVGMACIAQSVNVISPLMTTKDGIVKQTTWWPLWLFSRYMQGTTLSVRLGCGVWEGETQPVWLGGVTDTPWLDVSACVDDDGTVNLVVVNLHQEKSWEVELEGLPAGADVEAWTVTGKDVTVTNMAGKEEVVAKKDNWKAKGEYKFPKHSMTLLRWTA